jgi:hypothetical protein
MRMLSVNSAALVVVSFAAIATSQDKPGGGTFTIGEGKLEMTAPASWTRKEPASKIVEVEFSVPPSKGDDTPGRLTAMGAGGSIESNVDRWVGQFVGPDGGPARAVRDKTTVAGCEILIVDLKGTYKDSPGGPFAGGKTIMRENYRMVGAIIQTKDRGNYFLKYYGPINTITEDKKAFQEMVMSLKLK